MHQSKLAKTRHQHFFTTQTGRGNEVQPALRDTRRTRGVTSSYSAAAFWDLSLCAR